MLLHVSALQGHFQATLYENSNSLYANHIVYLRYVVDVPLFLFQLRLFLCYIRCVVFPCACRALRLNYQLMECFIYLLTLSNR
jgi:hypothetical protein